MIVDTCTCMMAPRRHHAGETKHAYLDDVSLQARFDYVYRSTQCEVLNANLVFD
jgi:hypothetical protein